MQPGDLSPVQACDMLVHSAVVLTVDGTDTVFHDGAVAISGGKILDVGPSRQLRERYRTKQAIDAGGALVHPGFIDAHIHISQYTARSVLPRMTGSTVNMGAWKAALRPEDEAASAELAAIDYFRSGYTGFVDPGTIFAPDAVAAAAETAGIRLWLTDPYVADLGARLAENFGELASPEFLARWPQGTEEALSRLGSQLKRNAETGGRVHAFIGIYGEGTASDPLFRAAVERARTENVQFQEHRRYAPAAYRTLEEGGSAIRCLAETGLLGRHVTFVHMNAVRPEEVPILAHSGTGIVWCPYGQLQMIGHGSAEPRMMELFRAGSPVGLATDIPRLVNFDALGGLAVANAAALGAAITPRDVLRMRTVGAAATVGADSWVGSIEPGKRADLVIRSPEDPQSLGAGPEWECAVLGLRVPPKAVVVDGEVVFRDGEPSRFEASGVVSAARRSVSQLLGRIGL